MAAITTARFSFNWPTYPTAHYAVGFAMATALHVITYYFGGLYENEQRLGYPSQLPKAALLNLLAVGADGLVALLTGRYLMPRANLLVLLCTGSLLLVFNRHMTRRIRSRYSGQPKILLVGEPDDIELARKHLQDAQPDVQMVGHAANDPQAISSEIERLEASDVLLLSGQSFETLYPDPLAELQHQKIGVYQRITSSDTLLGLQRVRQIGGMPFVVLRTHALPVCRLRFKRLLDLFYLLLLSPLFLPLTAVVVIWVRIRAGAGVIYRQPRVGFNGEVFTTFKFRTMIATAEQAGRPVLASRDDPRIIVGLGWLRRAHLDELPQLWNVFRGSMSIIGPRPERPEMVAALSKQIPGYSRRHDVPPGITGLAQTQAHYQTDAVYKLGYDLQYVVNWSPVLDWEIMLKSLLVMARASGQ